MTTKESVGTLSDLAEEAGYNRGLRFALHVAEACREQAIERKLGGDAEAVAWNIAYFIKREIGGV